MYDPPRPLYNVWNSMRQRCSNPKRKQFKDYGGRGISVCERWNKLENFEADMGPRPDGYTLERRDNSKNYEPSNCFWATRKAQRRNQRNVELYTHEGKTQCLADWALELGIKFPTLYSRIWRGLSFQEAIK